MYYQLADGAGRACDWGHMGGWGWGMMAFGWLFWILVLVLAGWAIWSVASRSGRPGRADAIGILEERLARGEISSEEYRERRRVLEER